MYSPKERGVDNFKLSNRTVMQICSLYITCLICACISNLFIGSRIVLVYPEAVGILRFQSGYHSYKADA